MKNQKIHFRADAIQVNLESSWHWGLSGVATEKNVLHLPIYGGYVPDLDNNNITFEFSNSLYSICVMNASLYIYIYI